MLSVKDCYRTKEQERQIQMRKLSIEVSKTTENKIDLLLKNTSASSVESLIALLIEKASKDLKQNRKPL